MTATVGISPVTPFQSGNYLTVAEYKNAPTAIDYDNLVTGGTSAQQDAELLTNIARASSFIDVYCNQPLIAQNFVENQRIRVTPEGYLVISPDYNNVVAVTSLNYGVTPTNMTAATPAGLAQIWFEKSQFIYPMSELGTTYSSVGPLSFGFPPSTRSRIYANYTYVAGFCNGLISTATAGQITLTMIDTVGITAGSLLNIWDGSNTETVTVASTYTFGSTTVPLSGTLKFTHAAGVAIGTMPQAIKQAAILIVNDFLKVRGDNSLTMSMTTRATTGPTGQQLIGGDLQLAKELLSPFRRMR